MLIEHAVKSQHGCDPTLRFPGQTRGCGPIVCCPEQPSCFPELSNRLDVVPGLGELAEVEAAELSRMTSPGIPGAQLPAIFV